MPSRVGGSLSERSGGQRRERVRRWLRVAPTAGLLSGRAKAWSSSSSAVMKRKGEHTLQQQYSDMAGMAWQIDVCLSAVDMQIGMVGNPERDCE